MNELRMRTGSDPAIQALIPARDRLAFARAKRILSEGFPFVLSDGESCLLVQSDPGEPAWVWTANDCPDEMLSALLLSVGRLLDLHRLPGVVGKGRFTRLFALAYAKVPMQRQRLNVYRMDELTPFHAPGEFVPGALVPPETAGKLIALLAAFGGSPLSAAERRDMGIAFAKSAETAAWRAPDGEIAAIAKRADVGDRYTDIHTVVTAEPYRNCGYAKALLSALCKQVLQNGRVPMLYADRDYAPSNSAYRKLGFIEAAHLEALRL